MPYAAEMFGSSIVAVGAFNPAIISPDWLEKNGLIGSDDADTARNNDGFVVTHQLSRFETDWFALQVVENQFSLGSKGAVTNALEDLAVGIFELLPHTPVTALGLNFFGHFKLASEQQYFAFGDILAPKDIWNEIFPDEEESVGLIDLSVVIQPFKRTEKPNTGNRKSVQVQPSSHIRLGIYLATNDHRELRTPDNLAEHAANIVDEDWDSAHQEAVQLFDSLMTKTVGRIAE